MAEKTLKVIVVGDSKSGQKALAGIEGAAKKMGDTGKKLTKNLTLPILGAGAALVALGVKAGQNADRLLDMEAQTGISTDTLQEFEFVAGQAGVSQDFFKKSAEEVIKSMDELAKGTGPTSEAWEALGISVRDSSGEMKSAESLTIEAMQALSAIEDPTKRAALAQDIFKRSNQDMLPVLAQGLDAIQSQRDAAHELGAVQSKEALEGANKFRMGMEKLKSGLGGIVGTLGAELAPLLSDVIVPLIQDHVVPLIRKFAEFVGGLAEKFNNLSPRMKGLIGGLIGVVAVAGPVLVVGSKLVKVFGVVGKAFGILSKILMANPWLLLIAAVIALVIIIVKNWDKITAFLAKTWDWIKDTADAVWEFLKAVFRKGLEFLKNLFLNWTGPGLIIKNFDKIRDAALAVKDWVVDKFTAIIDFFKEAPGKIADATRGMWDGIKNAFRAAINWLIDKWNNFQLKLGGQTVNLPFGLGFSIPSVTLRTPNIPRLHGGGEFRAATPGGEGLAILRDREKVLRPGDRPPAHPAIIQLVVDRRILAEVLVDFEAGLA